MNNIELAKALNRLAKTHNFAADGKVTPRPKTDRMQATGAYGEAFALGLVGNDGRIPAPIFNVLNKAASQAVKTKSERKTV